MKANSLKVTVSEETVGIYVWSCNYRSLPLGAVKENETEIFKMTTFKTVMYICVYLSNNGLQRHYTLTNKEPFGQRDIFEVPLHMI